MTDLSDKCAMSFSYPSGVKWVWMILSEKEKVTLIILGIVFVFMVCMGAAGIYLANNQTRQSHEILDTRD